MKTPQTHTNHCKTNNIIPFAYYKNSQTSIEELQWKTLLFIFDKILIVIGFCFHFVCWRFALKLYAHSSRFRVYTYMYLSGTAVIYIWWLIFYNSFMCKVNDTWRWWLARHLTAKVLCTTIRRLKKSRQINFSS